MNTSRGSKKDSSAVEKDSFDEQQNSDSDEYEDSSDSDTFEDLNDDHTSDAEGLSMAAETQNRGSIKVDNDSIESNDSSESGSSVDCEISKTQGIRKTSLKFLEYYNKRKFEISPVYMNLMTDMVESEVFLISGDAVLLEMLSLPQLDWSHGGQYLQLTYMVESFLKLFLDRGGHFHLVFFDVMAQLFWNHDPSRKLARNCMIHHLKHNTSVTLHQFQDWYCKKWTDYVQGTYPSLLVLSDGEGLHDKTILLLFSSLLSNCLFTAGLNCAHISEITHDVNNIFGFHIEAKIWLKNPKGFREKEVSFQDFIKQLPSIDNEKVDESEEKVLSHLLSHGLNFRMAANIVACAFDPLTAEIEAEVYLDLVQIFFLHSLLIQKLPLSSRAIILPKKHLPFESTCKHFKSADRFLQHVQAKFCKIISFIDEESKGETVDIMDGRLFYKMFYIFVTNQDIKINLPLEVVHLQEKVWNSFQNIVDVAKEKSAFSNGCGCLPLDQYKIKKSYKDKVVPKLLPVKCDLADEFAGDLREQIDHLTLNEKEVELDPLFDEDYHWHSGFPITDDLDRTKDSETQLSSDPWIKKHQLKAKQKYARYMHFYGSTLEGDSTKNVKSIVASSRKKNEKENPKKMSKKSQEIIDSNKKRNEEKNSQKEDDQWQVLQQSFKSLSLMEKLEKTKSFLSQCKTIKVWIDALMKKIDFCWKAWKEQCEKNRDTKLYDYTFAMEILHSIQLIYDSYTENLKHENITKICKYMNELGFNDIASQIILKRPDVTLKETAISGKYIVGMSSARFQMEHMGHLMPRDIRKDRDPRVDDFIPDTWQRKLLDVVDKNESAIVIAPTSSGKTFVSYYCIEKVLRADDEGIAVYVSPTKALVNQVASAISSKFGNRKKMPDGKSLYGVFTRDYRSNATNCQVLITVPQCLEILLLSPKRLLWASKLRYVIFDEVHCMGGDASIGNEVWEHLLVLIQCPFLALSATVSNPEVLESWLQGYKCFQQIQEERDSSRDNNSLEISGRKEKTKQKTKIDPTNNNTYKVRLLTYEERYSDLVKYIYLCMNFGEQDGEKRILKHIHPYTSLTLPQVLKNEFPPDLKLTSKEAIILSDLMKEKFKNLETLSPEIYFSDRVAIQRSDVRKYEKRLKQESEKLSKYEVEELLTSLKLDLKRDTENCQSQLNKYSINYTEDGFINEEFFPLIKKLKLEDNLPALAFHFDRKGCERLANLIREALEMEEQKYIDEHSSEYKQCLSDINKLEKQKKRTRDKERIKSDNPALETDDKTMSSLLEPNQELKEYEMSGMMSKFSYASTGLLDTEEFDKIISRIRYLPEDDPLKLCIKRGVAYHHSGMNNKERTVVEMLFRKRYLKVVVATGTLALGIHMPCRSVVFVGNSVYLNSLMYRQMSGRAGRRGFDNVGKVIFFGVPPAKIDRLIRSDVPRLKGNYPISTTLILRLLIFINHRDPAVAQEAKNKALRLLKCSFLFKTNDNVEKSVKQHFLFALEYLVRQGLIDMEGNPRGMAGLVAHLHYHDPSNFVLITFIKSKVLNQLCRRKMANGSYDSDCMKALIILLAHIFGRRYIPNYQKKAMLENRHSSEVILPDLEENFAQIIEKHDEEAEKIYHRFVQSLAVGLRKDSKLPLSGIDFNRDLSIEDESLLIKELLKESISKYSALSPFVALSGLTDADIHPSSNNLLNVMSSDNYLPENVIPQINLKSYDSQGREMQLNGYAYDFYKHGSTKILAHDNRINTGTIFGLLKDFYMTISAISTALVAMTKPANLNEFDKIKSEQFIAKYQHIVKAFEQLKSEYGDLFRKAYPNVGID